MVFDPVAEELQPLISLTETVANRFLDCLNNRFLFRAKLDRLQVRILPQTEELPAAVDGYFLEVDLNSEDPLLLLTVHPGYSQKEFAFTVAHELSHLFFSNVFFLPSALESDPDGSPGASVVEWILPDGESYGHALEEFLADYIARFVVEKLELDDETGAYAADMAGKQGRFELIETLMASLDACEKLDEYSFDEETEYLSVYSALWYSLAVMQADRIRRWYNACMGAYSFYLLNLQMETYLETETEDIKNAILENLYEFQNRWQEMMSAQSNEYDALV